MLRVYQFESLGLKLAYEAQQDARGESSIDFLRRRLPGLSRAILFLFFLQFFTKTFNSSATLPLNKQGTAW
jgi:hypothetical protein